MKKFLNEFKKFALRGNVMDMAVGIIIGGAFTGIVTSLTDNFINPILQMVIGGFKKETIPTWPQVRVYASNFGTAVVNFIIMAFILFCLLKFINSLLTLGKKKEAPAAPTTKVCPFCKSDIKIEATRCPHCTSEQPAE